ncbi:hypothetical protein BC936DRAFT_150140 [Jimgerdemannia flammicorona]|uniref:NADH-ubiquinone reductase complex 1 MLRQ subunit-domain-containing protein n=1 Tax=Jimgerdemannia flammicorona TaxID=994334 RepID=A0A433CZE2_9FUNG|nr:hypothetical protein BC936DRAFT_150140 [Jimgerdemannia flammicorona]
MPSNKGERWTYHVTIGWMLKQLRNAPPELVPLAIVVTAGITGAVGAIVHKVWKDPELRQRFGGKSHP